MSPGGRAMDPSGACWWATALVPLLLIIGATGLNGQFSPGQLSKPHAHLEGSGKCLECHQSARGIAPETCLSCHQILAQRIAAGRGLHVGDASQNCERCHIEHNGLEFELVWWGDAGREAFDHGETGYVLEGAHAKLGCEKCHSPDLIVAPQPLLDQGKDLSRTLLGLESACLSCHEDQHRGQVEPESCLDCHGPTAWKPAGQFDHGQTEFPLTGRHQEAACTKCHATRIDPATPDAEPYLEFGVAAFQRCTDCHRDPHEGRLGADCQRCHSTEGWAGYDRREFDHDLSQFPLVGEHRRVSCESCHPRGGSFRVARFAACADCHRDAHLGQFVKLPDDGACESCHTVEGFRPSTFDLARHQEGEYPLEGAHLASPCNACHRMVAVSELARHASLVAATPGLELLDEAIQFRFASTECLACHEDQHLGEVDRFVGVGGCQSCHVLESWHQILFDHDLTEFPLRGRHVGPLCVECHSSVEVGTAQERIGLKGASAECASCHDDIHLGQFVSEQGTAECQRCHGVEDWRASLFDHQTDSSYPLDGAHSRSPCDGCHKTETRDQQIFVRYKPVPTACEACHGGEIPAGL